MIKAYRYPVIPLFLMIVIVMSCSGDGKRIEPRLLEPSSLDDIVRFEDSLVRP
jgi:hypothetical protein